LRTARGAGRALLLLPPPERRLEAVEPLVDRLLALVEDRARVLPEPPATAPELRDPGGLDVRVGMLANLRDRHIRHSDPTPLKE
jgi:hypothetical protein